MSSLTSPPQQLPHISSAAPKPILSLKASPELTWLDRVSRYLPLVLIGGPLGLSLVLISAFTPVNTATQSPSSQQSLMSVSPDQVTGKVDVQP